MHSCNTIADRIAQLSPEKRALFEAQLSQQNQPQEAIAVVGIGCRFPQANDPESFWQLLQTGTDAITEVPSQRWNLDAFCDPDSPKAEKLNTRWGGFLDQVDQFDPYFFGISPREAERIDPQHRLLLEVAWEALEYAGQAPKQLAGSKTGVFVGISTSDYSQIFLNQPDLLDAYAATGNACSIAANRLSYLLDLRGPSLAVDTACSSSLVAVHLACQSLRNRECNLALTGGVNLILSPNLTIAFSQAQMMAADGRCKTFDARADGYVRGEGCGVVVLKRLSDAVKAGDRVLAVIHGSAVSQDGRSNGLTAPNGLAQQAVIREALKNARVTPEQISYIEVHGTGTALGDPIEVESLKAVFAPRHSADHNSADHNRADRNSADHNRADHRCRLGSVKTNIGHLEAAAGIASFIKVVLALQHGKIPPHLHLKQLNPLIHLQDTPFSVPTECQPWETSAEQRLAGISSFGFGGTIAHLVVAEAPAESSTDRSNENPIDRSMHLLTLSAKSEKALRSLVQKHQTALAAHTASLADVCFTTNVGRSHFEYRLALIADSTAALQEQLAAFAQGQQSEGIYSEQSVQKRAKIGFLFTGQGSQYPNMGRCLYETEPVFRQTIDRCSKILESYLAQPLVSVLYPETGEDPLLNDTAYTQPALFAVEYAIAQLWQSWGIEPDVVMGHSLGEYVAACVAGAISLEDGLKLTAGRGRMMQKLPADGAMAALFASAEQVAPCLAEFQTEVAIAALNSLENTVISGTRAAVLKAIEKLEFLDIRTCPLNVSHAFHSPLMEPILPAFEELAQTIEFQPLRLPLVANLTGELMQAGKILEATYWCKHILEPVQFGAGLSTLAMLNLDVMIEIGSHPTLTQIGKSALPAWKGLWLASLNRRDPSCQPLLESVKQLYLAGVPVNWSGFHQSYRRQRLVLPTYPFQRERYWLDVPAQIDRSRDSLNSPSETPNSTITEKLQYLVNKVDDTLACIRANRLPVFQIASSSGKDSKSNKAGEDRSNSNVHDIQISVNGSTCSASKPQISEPKMSEQVIRETVHTVLSEVGKIPKSELNCESRIHSDLGFDSLMLVEVRTKLMAAFPNLQDLPLRLLFSSVTVGGLIKFVGEAGVESSSRNRQTRSPNLAAALPHLQAWATEFRPGRPVRIEKHLVHKDSDRNVLIARLKLLQEDAIIGEITQDVQHSFFYEHAKDHVTGLYIIEAARQFGTALAHLYYDSPLEMSFVLDEMQTQFYKFAETNQPLFIVADIQDKLYVDENLAQMQVCASVVQAGDTVASVSGLFRIFSASKYSSLRKEALQV